MRNIFFLLMLSCLGGCILHTPKKINDVKILPFDIPHEYNSALQKTAEQEKAVKDDTLETSREEYETQAWWRSFKSDDLNKLEEHALENNFDILTAFARMKQFAALAKRAGASLYPSLNIEGGVGTTYKQVKNNPFASSGSEGNYNIGLVASYEIDLWGKINSEQEAAKLRYQASTEDLQAASVGVTAMIADTWVRLLGNRFELSVVKKQITINRNLVRMQQTRFSNSVASSLDVLQQSEVLTASLAEVPDLEQNAARFRHKLSVLLGVFPGDILGIDEFGKLPRLGSMPKMGLPVELLSTRPDIKAAWSRLQASQWDVSMARGARFPNIRLSAGYAFSAAESTLLFQNWAANLMAAIVAPVFDGGRLSAEEDRMRAIAEENLQHYIKSVAVAMQEVNDALAIDVSQWEKLELLQKQFRLGQTASEGTLKAYLEGTDTFFRFVFQLIATQDLERIVAKQKVIVIQARISLYRSLGLLYFPKSYLPDFIEGSLYAN